MTFLAAQNLFFSYEPRRPILQNLTFQVDSGQIMALVGSNGGGKSTLIGLLAGLLRPESGELGFNGVRGREAADLLRQQAALMPQNVDHWFLGETVAEDFSLGLDLDQIGPDWVEEVKQRWSLTDYWDWPVEQLSLGQKKRLALATAMVKRPGVVLLDEPLAGLDWPGLKLMLDDLAWLKKNGAICVVATHEPALLAPLIDVWLLMRPGHCLFGSDLSEYFEEFGVRPLTV